jgi:hypothetical protein
MKRWQNVHSKALNSVYFYKTHNCWVDKIMGNDMGRYKKCIKYCTYECEGNKVFGKARSALEDNMKTHLTRVRDCALDTFLSGYRQLTGPLWTWQRILGFHKKVNFFTGWALFPQSGETLLFCITSLITSEMKDSVLITSLKYMPAEGREE